jgi:NADPH-dependent 2,4-dienoyl-CoA reductase/sulfur reductase-like enzyme
MNLLIVGGVAGGAAAAARARRLSEDAHIILFERGPDVSFANCGLPYYLGGEISERDKLLVVTPERLRTRFNLDVRVRTSFEAIDRTAKKVRVRDLTSGGTRRARAANGHWSAIPPPCRCPVKQHRSFFLASSADPVYSTLATSGTARRETTNAAGASRFASR